MFLTRIAPAVLKMLKHFSIDAEKPFPDLAQEPVRDILNKYEKMDKKWELSLWQIMKADLTYTKSTLFCFK
jgi:hypothetical protein